jgi:phage gpG-like protein
MKDLSKFRGDMERWKREQERIMQTALPRLAGAIAVKGIKENFRRQGYGGFAGAWKPRKSGAPRNRGRALLVDTGALRRSVRSEPGRGIVTVYTATPYAQVHNEGLQVTGTASIKSHQRRRKNGGTSTVKAHTRNVNFKMPKRQFMPYAGQPLPAAWRKEIMDEYIKLVKQADRVFYYGHT